MPKQMLQRLPLALSKVKAGNTFKDLLNKTLHIVYYLYRAKGIDKNIYKNMINSMQCKNISLFMISENIKTSDPYRLVLNLADKVNLKRTNKFVTLSNLSIYYAWKNIKSHIKTTNLKY